MANAEWEDVLEYWRDPVSPGTPQVIASQRRGLGYYRRARNMHKAAQTIVKDFGGKLPRTYDDLKKLPGVGFYTAAAIASFAFGEKVPALDTNISRVFERVFGDEWLRLKPGERFAFAQKYIGALSGRDFNYGLMDLGALVCNARQPKCGECCFQKVCGFDQADAKEARRIMEGQARGLGKTQSFAFGDSADGMYGRRRGGKLKGPDSSIKVAAGVLIHNGKILICKRPKGKALAGLWEFPGGKLELREDERQCLKREMVEELGIEVAVRPAFYKTVTEHEGVTIRLSFHRCSLLLGEVKALEGQEFTWVRAAELDDYDFPPANREALDLLKEKTAMFYG